MINEFSYDQSYKIKIRIDLTKRKYVPSLFPFSYIKTVKDTTKYAISIISVSIIISFITNDNKTGIKYIYNSDFYIIFGNFVVSVCGKGCPNKRGFNINVLQMQI